jgi:hypothetical protein
MMESKVVSVALAPGRASSTRRATSSSDGFCFFSGTAPSFSKLLGVWRAEAAPSVAPSAARYEQPEWVFYVARVVAELKLVDVERHISFGHLVECAHDAVLEQRPEALNRVGVDRADKILVMSVPDHLMRILAGEAAIADPFIRDEQRDPYPTRLRARNS